MSDEFKRQSKRETSAKKTVKNSQIIADMLAGEIENPEPNIVTINKVIEKLDTVPINESLSKSIRDAGMTDDKVAKYLKDLFNWKIINKNGEQTDFVDGNLRLKAIEIWSKLTGAAEKTAGTVHQHLHLEKMPDDELDKLLRKANKSREDQEKS